MYHAVFLPLPYFPLPPFPSFHLFSKVFSLNACVN